MAPARPLAMVLAPALLAAPAAAQAPEHWIRHADGTQHLLDSVAAVAHGPGGTVSSTGRMRDVNNSWTILTVRYAADGAELWRRTYLANPAGFHNDTAVAAGVDAAGNTYVLGDSWGGLRPAGGEFDYVLIKYSPAGEQLWVRRYNGPGNWSDTPTDMEVDAAGNCYISGFAFFQPDLFNRYATDFHVIKYTAAGDVAWEYHTNNAAGGNVGAGARAIALDAAGNVYATGVINSGDGFNNDDDFLTVKLTGSGELVYRRVYSSPGFNTGQDDGKVVAADAAGNAYVAGSWMPEDSTERHRDVRTIKYSPAGDLLWTTSTTRPREESPTGIVADGAGNVYVGGAWLAATENNGFLESYDASGGFRWEYVLDEEGTYDENWINGVKLGSDGNVYAGADNQRPGGTGYDPTLLKFSPAGEVLLRESFHVGSTSDSCFAFDLDPQGNAFLGGHSTFAATGADFMTVKVFAQGGPPACAADWDGDSAVNSGDISAFLTSWLGSVSGGDLAADFNADGAVNSTDISAFLTAWLDAVQSGC